ncbi:MAG: Asp-tRNA(Asn)/Glu-tRNA(Gln) amidotransferase subunit GatB [Armatimonadota bacterium]
MDFITAIGLEIHVELKTESKLFCGCRNKFTRDPNTNVCPVCLGYPGVLPVVNEKAVELLIRSALSLNCSIASFSKFDRKNYFYPDMPKNYQVSQYDMPLAENGYITVGDKKIRIKRIHLEEDTGKSVHKGTIDKSEYTLEDYNRAGVPLMEIVTEPDIFSPEEAYEFLTKLKKILEWIGVSDCRMEEGSLRCDANISVRDKEKSLSDINYKVEIKNMNSFKSVLKALSYEQERQTGILKDNGVIDQSTRGWDEDKQITFLMRSKEEVHDYRYFPEPDLLPMEISGEWINRIKEDIFELPEETSKRFIEKYGLNEYDSSILIQSVEFSRFFEEAVRNYPEPKIICNWLTQDISKVLNDKGIDLGSSALKVDNFIKLLNLIKKGVISGKIAKDIITDIIEGKDPEEVIKEKNLAVISDSGEVEKIIDKVLDDNTDSVEKYKKGHEKVFVFLVGQIMKESRGKADPKSVNELLKKKLERR